MTAFRLILAAKPEHFRISFFFNFFKKVLKIWGRGQKIDLFIDLFIVFLKVLGLEPRTSCMLNKDSTTELYPPGSFVLCAGQDILSPLFMTSFQSWEAAE